MASMQRVTFLGNWRARTIIIPSGRAYSVFVASWSLLLVLIQILNHLKAGRFILTITRPFIIMPKTSWRRLYCVSWCVGPLPNEADSRHNSQQSSPPTKENIWYVEGGLVTLTATPNWFHRRFKKIFAQNCFWEERSAITINFVPHTGRLFARYNYPLGLVFQKYCKFYA